MDALSDEGISIIEAPMCSGSKYGLGYEPESESGWQVNSSRTIIHTVPEYYKPVLQDLNINEGCRFGYTVWETSHIPPSWPELLNRMNGIIVPTKWNKEIFLAQGVTADIKVVPHISQFEGKIAKNEVNIKAKTDISYILQPVKGRFLFYSIGMWIPRKGMDLLLETFGRAFTSEDPVALVIKTSALDFGRKSVLKKLITGEQFYSVDKTIINFKKRYPNAAPVLVFTDYWDDAHINALHAAGDAYITLSRAEGWGLGAWEAAWFAKPLIASGFIGFMSMFPKDYPGIVAHSMVTVPDYDPWRRKSDYFFQEWAEPDLESAVEIMQNVIKHPDVYREAALKFKLILEQSFTKPKIAKLLKEALGL
jgi:glycosyltransferase involved in cell wall biosynthesis